MTERKEDLEHQFKTHGSLDLKGTPFVLGKSIFHVLVHLDGMQKSPWMTEFQQSYVISHMIGVE